jgi:hypothetical protein
LATILQAAWNSASASLEMIKTFPTSAIPDFCRICRICHISQAVYVELRICSYFRPSYVFACISGHPTYLSVLQAILHSSPYYRRSYVFVCITGHSM